MKYFKFTFCDNSLSTTVFFTIHHIGNILNNLKKTSKTGRNTGFKDISTLENPAGLETNGGQLATD